MTPEQEDAHWALQGKPFMRHWLAYRGATRSAGWQRSMAFNRFVQVIGAAGSRSCWKYDGVDVDGVFYPDDVEDL